MSAAILDAIDKLSKPWATWRAEAKTFAFGANEIAEFLETVEPDSLPARIAKEFSVIGDAVAGAVAPEAAPEQLESDGGVA